MSQQLELCMMDILKTREKIRDTHEELSRIEYMYFDLLRKFNKENDSKEQDKILDLMNDCSISFETLNRILNDRCADLDEYYSKYNMLLKRECKGLFARIAEKREVIKREKIREIRERNRTHGKDN